MNKVDHWNYRVIVHKEGDNTWFDLHRVLYDADNNIVDIDENCNPAIGESTVELFRDLQYMLEAFLYPVIELDKEASDDCQAN